MAAFDCPFRQDAYHLPPVRTGHLEIIGPFRKFVCLLSNSLKIGFRGQFPFDGRRGLVDHFRSSPGGANDNTAGGDFPMPSVTETNAAADASG